MTILRGALPTDSYTIISNAWLRDPTLSWKAKGLLAYIASHAAGHSLTIEQVLAEGVDGKDAVRAGLVELERRGYLLRTQLRGDGGRIVGTDYTLGQPLETAGSGSSSAGKPVPGPDQPEQDVSAGGDQGGKSSAGEPAGKKTSSKKTREDEDPFDAEASETAQTIVAGFIDWLRVLPSGPIELTPSVIGRYGKAIKALLQAKYDVVTIKRALAFQTESGKAGWPSMLDSFCVQVQNRPTSGAPRTYKQMDRDDDRLEDLKIQAMDGLLEQYPEMKATDARKLVDQAVAAGKLDLNGLSTRAVTGYIEAEVINAGVQEVTGS